MPHYPELQLYVAGKWRRRTVRRSSIRGTKPFSARRRTRPAPISSRTWCCNPALRKSSMYSDVSLFIDGNWTKTAAGRTIPVVNPATGEDIGTVAHADKNDLDRALEAADKGFRAWRKISAFDRSKIMRKAANLLRERADAIAPLADPRAGQAARRGRSETLAGADVIDWFAEEARRAYGRVIPARAEGRLPACGQGAGRPRRGLHAVELPDQPGRAQTVAARSPPAARSSSRRRRKPRPRPPS